MLNFRSMKNSPLVKIIMASTFVLSNLRSAYADRGCFGLPTLMLLKSQSSNFSSISNVDSDNLVKVVNEKVVFSGYRDGTGEGGGVLYILYIYRTSPFPDVSSEPPTGGKCETVR